MAPAKPLHMDVHGAVHILSVDDDPVNCMVIEQILKTQGWKCTSAQDGGDALAILNEEDCWPDFVFLDFTMNVGDNGDVICKKMRQVFGEVPVPIVMCTAMSEGSAALTECKMAGATDILLKPYEREKMFRIIRQYVPKVDQPKPAQAPQFSNPASALEPALVLDNQAAVCKQDGPAHDGNSSAFDRQPGSACRPAGTEASPVSDLMRYFLSLDLEYCGQKLEAAGFTKADLDNMDDTTLRKAGIVVKSQREKILANIFSG